MDFSSFFYYNNNNCFDYNNNYNENKLNNFDLFTNNSINDDNNNNNDDLELLNENIFLNKKTNFSYEDEENNLNEIDDSTFPSTNININNNNNNNEKNNFIKQKKNFYNLNEEIISLMKQEKTPLNVDFIYSKLKDKKDLFRKKNGSKYKNDFKKSITYTLRTSGYFNKTYDNKYTYNDDNSIFLIKNKNLNFNKKNLVPIDIKIQLKKVNNLIKKLHNKYKGDPKYFQVIYVLDFFRNLLDKYLMLIKYKKDTSIFDLCILNEKIISICYQIEKMEKTEIFNIENDNFKIERGKNKNNNINNINNERNIFLFNGENNVFTEPPTIF